MVVINKSIKYIFFLIILTLYIRPSIGFSTYNQTMTITTDDSELEIYYINYEDINNETSCNEWIPSLFIPMLLTIDPSRIKTNEIVSCDAIIPTLSLTKKNAIKVFNYEFLYFNASLGYIRFTSELEKFTYKCFFGLSSKYSNFSNLNDSLILINKLKDNKEIAQKIFSFDKWKIYENLNKIDINFYFGYEPDVFKSKNKDGIIGECEVGKDYYWWGCPFTYMMINNEIINLTNTDEQLYKIYFSTENYNIIFPVNFNKTFINSFNGKCSYNSEHIEEESYFLQCNDTFNKEEFIPLQLISNEMNITIEIDNKIRFNKGKNENRTRIRFEKVDYFILPLIMFKNFHVLFDAENNKIKFFTTNQSILQIKKDKKKNSSNASTIFLIIFIIILIIAIGYGIFWFLKKRRGSVEKNINKYNKFDEDENFQNMNEKRVF